MIGWSAIETIKSPSDMPDCAAGPSGSRRMTSTPVSWVRPRNRAMARAIGTSRPCMTQVAANDPPVLHELGKDPLDHVDRDREADALGGMNDGRVHADHPALRIEQRAAAIARVERSVGLDHVVDQVAR